MGGASRNEKKRRQEAANERLAAAGITPPQRSGNRTGTVVLGAVVAVAVVVGLVLWWRGSDDPVAAEYPVNAAGAVVTAGQASAPVAVDVFSDYVCPGCERFEQRYGDEMTEALNAGRLTVRHHAVGLLDENSDPAGYSSRAANASVCAAAAGVFPAYHARLFAEMPAQGGPGLSDDQLVGFGTELGAPASFGECVRSGANADAVAAETQAMIDDTALRNAEGEVATPTVLLDGARVDLDDTSWLSDALPAE